MSGVWDHIISQDEAAHLACVYDNLLLACQCGNRIKSNQRVPDPARVGYSNLFGQMVREQVSVRIVRPPFLSVAVNGPAAVSDEQAGF